LSAATIYPYSKCVEKPAGGRRRDARRATPTAGEAQDAKDTSNTMSRLDSFIRRLSAQRDILNAVADEVRMLDGPVLELGLGNGRTFDHLRELFPDRRIIAFDRAVNAYGPSVPSTNNLVLGEIKDTAKTFVGANASLAHADIGTGYEDKDAITLTWLPQIMAGVLASGGLAVSGLPLDHPDLEALALPSTVKDGRYFIYRRK
jgi:hypothetical protein